MSFDSLKGIAHELNPSDFFGGLYDGAVEQPLFALKQLAGKTPEAPEHKHDTLMGKAGSLAGFILDFTVLAKLTGGAVDGALGKSAGTVMGNGAKMFVAGGLYGGLLTPSDPNKSLLEGRLENAAVSGATFAVMGGAGKALEGASFLGKNAFVQKVAGNAIAGGAGGVVEAYGSVYFNEHRRATLGEVLSSAGQYAAFGAGFSALDYGLAKGISIFPSPVRDAYYRASWKLGDAKVEAKRMTYEVLNKYDLRHPWQRFSNFVTGHEFVELPRPALTAENNPAVAFEKGLPEYFRKIDAKENEIAELSPKEYEKRRDLFDETKEIKADFVHDVLKWWHGNSELPGIKSFSDAELATSEIPAERVAQIRKALLQSGKGDYSEVSPLTQSLADLANFELYGRRGGEYEFGLLDGFDAGKARFFGYSDDEISHKFSLGRIRHAVNREYGTPASWLPTVPNEKLAGYFHGSISNSLDSIFAEKQMLSSYEQRLRGQGQNTGESAGQEFPRKAISLARSLSEAFAYHRHSPAYLTSYPVVFGIAPEVAAKAYPAGMLEPGEVLVKNLKLGENLWTKLGLSKPDITHLYVPDSMVAGVNQQLVNYQIKGLKVLGFNELPQPTWSNQLPPGLEHVAPLLEAENQAAAAAH